jgi:hypothetical protein
MKFKNRASFAGCTSDGKNPKFLAINHETITRDLVGKKAIVHRFTILRPLRQGFSSAPYKSKNPGKNPDAKPLSILTFGEKGPVMQMFSYPKVGMFDKGPRSDLSWTLTSGNTIKLWLDEERIKDDTLLPKTNIEAFTLCEISVASKTEESVKSGWCIKITNVRPVDYSLCSIPRDLEFLCMSLGEARTREMIAKQEQPLLDKELETQSVAFWRPIRLDASIDDSDGIIRLINWGDPTPVELPVEPLMRATNCRRIDWACALLEIGIAVGAASVLVFANDFWKGGPRGMVVIDTDMLLCSFTGAWVMGDTTKKTATPFFIDGQSLQIEISNDPISVAGESPPQSDDFALTGLETELSKAYAFQFNLVRDDGEVVPAIWKGFYNAGPTNGTPAFSKRKRLQTMDE